MIPQLSQDILRYLRVHSETQRLALLPISLSRTRAHSPRGPHPPHTLLIQSIQLLDRSPNLTVMRVWMGNSYRSVGTLRLYGAHQCNQPRRRGTLRMQIELSASEIRAAKKADDRGRVTLGSEYAGKTVTVAVLEVEVEDE